MKSTQKDRLKALVEEIEAINTNGCISFEQMKEKERLEKELFNEIKKL